MPSLAILLCIRSWGRRSGRRARVLTGGEPLGAAEGGRPGRAEVHRTRGGVPGASGVRGSSGFRRQSLGPGATPGRQSLAAGAAEGHGAERPKGRRLTRARVYARVREERPKGRRLTRVPARIMRAPACTRARGTAKGSQTTARARALRAYARACVGEAPHHEKCL